MYLNGNDLEATYVQGHRMLSFLTECLPQHPEYRRLDASELRAACREQLELLRDVILDLEMRIDEEQCNQFFTNFDPILVDEDDSDDDEDIPSPQHTSPTTQDMIDYASWKDQQRKVADSSPTSETVTTVGTECSSSASTISNDHISDETSSDESVHRGVERKLNFGDVESETCCSSCHFSSSYSKQQQTLYTMEFDSDFLDRIANEDVRYETDSEAADSWAQQSSNTDNDSLAPSATSSGGGGVTCDPARLAIQELLARGVMKPRSSKRATKASIPSEMPPRFPATKPTTNALVGTTSKSSQEGSNKVDIKENTAKTTPTTKQENRRVRFAQTLSAEDNDDGDAAGVDCEIEDFLNSSIDQDPHAFIESSMKRLNRPSSASPTVAPSSFQKPDPPSTRHHADESSSSPSRLKSTRSAFSSFANVHDLENVVDVELPFDEEPSSSTNDNWVSFDDRYF